MKRCPTCNRSFDDDTLSFCLEDGTPLVRDSAGRADSQETLVSPSPSARAVRCPRRVTISLVEKQQSVRRSSMHRARKPTFPPPKQRRTWPWVVAILAIVFIVIGGIVIAAIVIPPMLRNSGNDKRAQPTPARPTTWTTATPAPAASPTEEADDVPDDEDEVLAQLTKLEEEWTRANVKGRQASAGEDSGGRICRRHQ